MRGHSIVISIVFASACTGANMGLDPDLATYAGILDEPITLVAGSFEGDPFVAGGASRPIVMLLEAPRASGDLTGDDTAEQAVVLAASSGGSGTFIYLAVLGPGGAAGVNLATAFLGDRVRVSELRIESEVLEARMLAHAPGDPSCCPSEEIVRRWRLAESELAELE